MKELNITVDIKGGNENTEEKPKGLSFFWIIVWVLSIIVHIPCLVLQAFGVFNDFLFHTTVITILTGVTSFIVLFYQALTLSEREHQGRGEKSSLSYLGM